MDIDSFSNIRSPLHSWDARWKLGTLIFYIFISASVQKVYSLALISVVSTLLVLSARMPPKIVGKSLKPVLLFLIIMFPVISLTSGGEILYSYGLIRFYKDGLIAACIIAIRALSIMLVTIVLFGSTRLNVIMKAMEFFRVPSEISAIFLFTYRYIFLYFENIARLFTAAKLRGYSLLHGMRHLRNTVNILVTLLIRSYEQSERVYYAMRLRGFTGSFRTISSFSTVWSDAFKTGLFIMIFLTILGIELL